MSTSHPTSVDQHQAWMPIHESQSRDGAPPTDSRATRAASLQRAGRAMVIAGFVITVVGIVAYCMVTFAGGLDVDMGDLLLHNAVPFARATLAVLGLGTLVWLVGSFTYLRGAMDADEDTSETGESSEP